MIQNLEFLNQNYSKKLESYAKNNIQNLNVQHYLKKKQLMEQEQNQPRSLSESTLSNNSFSKQNNCNGQREENQLTITNNQSVQSVMSSDNEELQQEEISQEQQFQQNQENLLTRSQSQLFEQTQKKEKKLMKKTHRKKFQIDPTKSMKLEHNLCLQPIDMQIQQQQQQQQQIMLQQKKSILKNTNFVNSSVKMYETSLEDFHYNRSSCTTFSVSDSKRKDMFGNAINADTKAHKISFFPQVQIQEVESYKNYNIYKNQQNFACNNVCNKVNCSIM